jgi:hypothetical protein
VIDVKVQFLGAVYAGVEELKQTLSTEEAQSRWKKSFFGSIVSSITNALSVVTSMAAPLPPANELIEKNISLTIFSARADVTVSEKIAKDLVRSTKKEPPKEVVVDVVYVCHSLSACRCWSCLVMQ